MFIGSDEEEDEDMAEPPLPQQQQQQQQHHFCAMCNKKFSRSDLLRKHQQTHVATTCNVCGQILTDKFALTKHQIEVSQNTFYQDKPKIFYFLLNSVNPETARLINFNGDRFI